MSGLCVGESYYGSEREGFSISKQESHCFNYVHVITSINCNVFVWGVGASVGDTPCNASGKTIKRKRKNMGKTNTISLVTRSQL